MLEVREKGCHCANRWCHLPLKCDTRYLHTAQLNVSSVYLCSRPTCKNVLVAQYKLSGNDKTC